MQVIGLLFSWLPPPLYILVMAAVAIFGLILVVKLVVLIMDLIPIF